MKNMSPLSRAAKPIVTLISFASRATAVITGHAMPSYVALSIIHGSTRYNFIVRVRVSDVTCHTGRYLYLQIDYGYGVQLCSLGKLGVTEITDLAR